MTGTVAEMVGQWLLLKITPFFLVQRMALMLWGLQQTTG